MTDDWGYSAKNDLSMEVHVIFVPERHFCGVSPFKLTAEALRSAARTRVYSREALSDTVRVQKSAAKYSPGGNDIRPLG
jgi:hypothetical protein